MMTSQPRIPRLPKISYNNRKNNGTFVFDPRQLIPHSPEWFAVMEALEPVRTMITMGILIREGRTDVCSVCGDTPAQIYDDLDFPYLPLRLCADCIEIRRGLGEHLKARAAELIKRDDGHDCL